MGLSDGTGDELSRREDLEGPKGRLTQNQTHRVAGLLALIIVLAAVSAAGQRFEPSRAGRARWAPGSRPVAISTATASTTCCLRLLGAERRRNELAGPVRERPDVRGTGASATGASGTPLG